MFSHDEGYNDNTKNVTKLDTYKKKQQSRAMKNQQSTNPNKTRYLR